MTIEVAHFYLEETRSMDDLAVNIRQCRTHLESIDISQRAVVMMLDDQRIKKKYRANRLLPVYSLIIKALPIDFVCFETDLNIYKACWLQYQTNAQALSKLIKYSYNGAPQCSHYLAIWYLMRLGIIEDTAGIIMPVSERAPKIQFAHPTELTSILPKRYKEVEDMTDETIFRYLTIPVPRFKRIYF